ncbi:hypothetical protein [Amycolatopsis kentuckyensis]|uniref:hypothetical protein n=1 Tax=Amycolatopsis kentuckyensis TaxID=218823 RepID=UPI000A383EBE|nr:hypothetical protein [Amycolatopsis kentuckyensis]
MPARTAWTAATLVVGFFATIGVLSTPVGGLVGLLLLGPAIGTLAAVIAPHVRRAGPARPRAVDLRAGAVAAGIFFALCFTVSGMVATLGGRLTAALVVVLASAVLVAGLRRKSLRSGPHEVAPPARPIAELSTDELCAAWQRSYCRLLVTHDVPARRHLVQRRQDYLDEIEHRDRSGFLRWLADGARPGSNPGPYLTTPR